MTLSCIVAVSDNGVIGRDNALPWHLPADLKRFKNLTMGHTIVMGRKTFESIGRPLPGRTSIVLSRRGYDPPEGVLVAGSLDEALDMCGEDTEVFVIGGASVFREALPRCDRIYLTRVHADIEGDTTFPLESIRGWTLRDDERHAPDEKHPYAYSFQVYVPPEDSAAGS